MAESPYLAVYNTESDESIIVARKIPYRQNIVFSYTPGKGKIKIQWTFNSILNRENPLILDKVYIRTGRKRELLNRLISDISKKNSVTLERKERVVWTLPYEFNRGIRFKTVEDNLAVLEKKGCSMTRYVWTVCIL